MLVEYESPALLASAYLLRKQARHQGSLCLASPCYLKRYEKAARSPGIREARGPRRNYGSTVEFGAVVEFGLAPIL
jgi:hypothetical protein